MSGATETTQGVKRSASSAFGRAALLLAIASVIAAACAAAIFAFVFHAEFLTGAAAALARVMFAHSALAVGAAASPIVAVLLVGYAYMQRGIRRRAARGVLAQRGG
jgi:hypothetical protein